MDEEHVLVDEVAVPQRLDQLSAAQDGEIWTRLLFEVGHGVRGIALKQRGVHPGQRFGQRP
jgi:hypothetical protein